jgi:hypothetical protein
VVCNICSKNRIYTTELSIAANHHLTNFTGPDKRMKKMGHARMK